VRKKLGANFLPSMPGASLPCGGHSKLPTGGRKHEAFGQKRQDLRNFADKKTPIFDTMNFMKPAFVLALLFALPCLSFAQKGSKIAGQAIHFQLPAKDGAIDFIVLDTVLTAKKPVFLFCQGSLPMPLFFEIGGKTYLFGGGVSNFDLAEIREKYHLVVVSMPHTPVVVGEANLNESYCYVPDSAQKRAFSPDYVKADFLENYARRGNAVLKFLKKQPWADGSKLVVAGHSQGSKVATKIARSNRRVTHLGLFAANPFGRADQFVRDARKKAERGQISWAEADAEMERQYQYFRDAHHADSLAARPDLLAWKSFSESFLDDWLALDIPIFLAYGTADITSDLCDLVPLFFIQNGKTNLTQRRYLHLEHNFFETKADGRADYEKPHWHEVTSGFLKWAGD
jgi:pimeloyl-ACP methyl ester carboxylesterase